MPRGMIDDHGLERIRPLLLCQPAELFIRPRPQLGDHPGAAAEPFGLDARGKVGLHHVQGRDLTVRAPAQGQIQSPARTG